MSDSTIKKVAYAEALTSDALKHAGAKIGEETIALAAAGLQRLIEGEIRSAIGRYLGRNDFTMDELRGRCERTIAPSGDETWFIDNTPVLLVYPTQLVEFDERARHVYEARRSVRQLRF